MPEDYNVGLSELNREIVGVYLKIIRDYYPNTNKSKQEALIKGLEKIVREMVEKNTDKKSS